MEPLRCTLRLASAGGAQPHRRACALLRRCSAAVRQRRITHETLARAVDPPPRPWATHKPCGRPARHLTQKPSLAPSHKPSRRRRARRRDPHLRGGPGRRPQPPAHDGELCRRQGQEGRDLRRVRGGRRRYRSLCLSNSVAQWIAYQTSNLGVAGSSPVGVVVRLMDWTSEGYEFESHIGFTAVLGLLQDSVAEWLRR